MVATTDNFAREAERLGLAGPDVRALVELRRAGDCPRVQARMTELVAARREQIQAQLGGVFAEQAAAGGLFEGSATEPLQQSIPLAKAAGRLQAAAEILAEPPGAGGCTDDCPCSRAAAVTAGAYPFPTLVGATPATTPDGLPIVCTLDADGEDLVGRVDDWQKILGHATGRESTPDGIAVTFAHDIARTAELARLLAAEYSCCSFASYHLTIDSRGVRMEIHAPAEGRDALAAMFGSGS